MSIGELLVALKNADMSLVVDGDVLVAKGNKRLITKELKQALKDNKQEIISFIKAHGAISAASAGAEVVVPPVAIKPDSTKITPEMLPLIELRQEDIEQIIDHVPGGIANIQDIYALSPLQDGILFHHLLAREGDPYILISEMAFPDKELLDRFLIAVQQVVNRHDILRTAFMWEGLSKPAQVVVRQAKVSVTELELDPKAGPIAQQLVDSFNPRQHRMDLTRAPLLHFAIAYDAEHGRWVVLQRFHHLIGDHSTLDVLHAEVYSFLLGQEETLARPQPFRNLVAQTRLGIRQEEHERFFREMLGEITEPTLPFGLSDIQQDGGKITEAYRMLPHSLNDRLRAQARRLGVSVASLCHVAWGQVLARCSGQERVVFGTVLFGRMQGGKGADQAAGLFINTLPLRLDLDDTGSEAIVHDTHARLAELLTHEHASLALAQRCSGVAAPNPLFSAILNYRYNLKIAEADSRTAKFSPLKGVEFLVSDVFNNYPLTIEVEDFGDALGLSALVAEPVLPERVCKYMACALESLAVVLEARPQTPVRQLEILPAEERELLLEKWNATEAEYPEGVCIQELFEEQADKNGEATAVVYEEQSLSYGELNREANRLAHYLIGMGVKPDDRVAICVERSLGMVVGLLAILKAGGAYVPLDPAYPIDRLRYMIEDSAPMVLLTQGALREVFAEYESRLSIIDLDYAFMWQEGSESNPEPGAIGVNSGHLAYVIYTSGSTGTPKGVMVEHRNLVNSTLARSSCYGKLGRFLLLSSISFDSSVAGIFGTLTNGGTLLIANREMLRDPKTLSAFIQCSNVESLLCIPSLYQQTLKHLDFEQGKQLKCVIVAGESCMTTMVRQSECQLPQVALFNEYGPTECTVWCSVHRLEQSDTRFIPIGRPITNAKIYILDARQEPSPPGVTGELYVGGAGVTPGYWNRPKMTAERFVPNPFSNEPGQRMYRTGDLARWLVDGKIEFVGRNDDQVKLRGFRIELGEIEARLAEHPSIREVAVILREDDPGDKRLVAYYTSHGDEQTSTAEQLRVHLTARVPEHMVPAAFVRMKVLPLTVSGKVDRKKLPSPEGNAYAAHRFEPPQGETETQLAEIWTEVLEVERVGRNDNFFELGGHSLLAVTLIERMNRLGLQVDVPAIFATPTLKDLAASVDSEPLAIEVPPNCIPSGCTAITPEMLPLMEMTQQEINRIVNTVPGGGSNVQDMYPLAPLQEGILFHHLMGGDGDPYLSAAQISFDTRDRLDRYLSALQAVINRHDILRTAVVWEGLRHPVQVVWRKAQLHVEEIDFELESGEASEQLHARFNPRRFRIDVRCAPLLRVYVIHDRNTDRWLSTHLLHHLAVDHTTLEVMQEEVRAHLSGQEATLTTPLPFRNLVAHARMDVGDAESDVFFRKMLGDIHETTAPFGLLNVRGDGSDIEEAHLVLEDNLARRIRDQARKLRVSAASMCHLAWAQVLARTSGCEDVVFGTVLFGRMQGGEGADRVMGLFINTLPIRIRVNGEDVETSVRQTHRLLAELMRHEHAALALAQKCSGVPAPEPLFSALLNYRHSPLQENSHKKDRAWDGIEWILVEERTNYPLTLSVDDLGEGFELTAQTLASVGPERMCHYMCTTLTSLVEALEEQPRKPVRDLEVVSTRERDRILREWNDTEADIPFNRSVNELFEDLAVRLPEATAVVFEDAELTYAELNQAANCLAYFLKGLGVQPEDRIALYLDRSIDLVVAEIAVLKCGAAYVPIETNSPKERQRGLLADCSPSVILLGGDTDLPDNITVPRVDVRKIRPNGTNYPNLCLSLDGDNAAYVMYTSGSSGTPKGVIVPHRAITRLVINSGFIDFRTSDRVAFAANPAFDASTLEVWGPLLNGCCVVVIPDHIVLRPDRFAQALKRYTISVLWLTVGLFNQYAKVLSGEFAALRYLIVGGDKLNREIVADMLDHNPPDHLLNGYGPTECTTFSATYEIKQLPDRAQTVPIGRPIGNTQIYLLNGSGQPVPVGAVGEIYIGGAGVARGYLNRPELTAERFVPDPYSAREGARMYKTGDLARYLPDGNIEFLGRNDFQVKIRGFRIELGEIEARLSEHEQVREALVMAREDSPGEKRLVAYYSSRGEEAVGAEQLRAYLGGRLPEYMVPAAFVHMEALPLTPNGKLDRKALPVPEGDAYAQHRYEEPQGEMERALATLWQELLGIERVGRNDHFFELGGHSLLAVQLIEKLRSLNLQLGVRSLFANPILSKLAATLVHRYAEVVVPPVAIKPDSTKITPEMLPLIELRQEDIEQIIDHVPGGIANIQDIYALSPLQDGILFHHLLAREGDPYILISEMAFPDKELLDRFLIAVQQVVNRHDILRTAFMWEGLSKPAQVVVRQAQVSVTELELDPKAGPIAQQLVDSFNPRQHRMDLTRAPLLHFAIAYDAEHGRWVVLQRFHHLIGDHSTLDVLHAEVYSFLLGQEETLARPQPFRNLVAQTRLGIRQEEHERFFREMLGEITEPTLPFGLSDIQQDGGKITEAYRMLPHSLNDRLRAQARRLGVSVASLCHVAWGQVLARCSGQERVVFGTVLFGRMQGGKGADQAAGLFINTLPLRLDLDDTGSEAIVHDTHARLAELLTHEHASLALAQRCSGVAAPNPLFSAILNYRYNLKIAEADSRTAKFSPLKGVEFLVGDVRNNYPLTMSVEDFGDALGLTALVAEPVLPERVCKYMACALESLAVVLEARPQTPVRQLEILPAEERELLLEKWNATEAEYPEGVCIQELFEEQADKNGEATAVVYEEQSLSYGELNREANRLAHYLIGMGVKPDDRVAICVERSLGMVVGLLAILKAGGAYVPLDPAYPSGRLVQIVGDAAPRIVLSDGAGKAALGEAVVQERMVLDVEADRAMWKACSEQNPEPEKLGLTSRNLAYVIYTSGSTGTPKGVMIEHRSVTNFQHAVRTSIYRDCFSQLRVGWNASFSFDMSIKGFSQLLSGHCLVVIPQQVRASGRELMDYLQREEIDAFDATPSQLCLLLEGGLCEPATKKRIVLVGGEPIEKAMWERLKTCRAIKFHNMYGPTECTVDATIGAVNEEDDVPHIGRPVANTQIYLLNGSGQPVPVGAVGEIYIGGAGVARGYLNRPELTAERFVPDPYSAREGARMYKTGDLARYLPDGNIEFLGRNDFQVKIRGFRIELGEIEARLSEHEQVREALVMAREDSPGEKRLVAYYSSRGEEAVGAEQLRAYLGGRLPEYMVPAAFVHMEALPLTPNGKLDRKALPVPEGDAYAQHRYEEPQGEMERALATLWQELLGIERVGRNDHFFELGGHSLLAVQLVARVRQTFAKSVALGDLFAYPTLSSFAALIEQDDKGNAGQNLVQIRSRGCDHPVFFIHPGGGSVDYARQLAPFVPDEIPIYGLQARGLSPGEKPLENIDEISSLYAKLIRQIQRHGPYRLAGWSAGGTIAYEIACFMIDQGEEVEFVGLLDTYCHQTRDQQLSVTNNHFDDKTELLDLLSPYGESNVMNGLRAMGTTYDFERLLGQVYELRLVPDEFASFTNVDVETIRCILATRYATNRAVKQHRLVRADLPAWLFEASESDEPASISWLRFHDKIRIIPISGTHTTMLKGDNLQSLGIAISRVLTTIAQGSSRQRYHR